MATRSKSGRQVLTSGPWKGVRDTIEPFDDSEDYLSDALNIYIPDPDGASGAFARAGFKLANGGAGVYAGRGQCVYTHQAVDGQIFSFIVGGGKIYRANGTLTSYTDVTPTAGVTISATAPRVKMISLGDFLIVSDGVHKPWIAGNLGSTPITGTTIKYDAADSNWAAQDLTVWGGAVVAILKQVAGVARQSDISWSEPGTPDVGWQQLDFDNNWTLEQTGSSPLWAVVGTNVALYYFRQRSIGAISGTIGPDLESTSTHDAISFNVGTRTPASIQVFGNYIYFADSMGRAWRVALGETPEAIWLNMRAQVDRSTIPFVDITTANVTSVFDTSKNLYLLAAWTTDPLTNPPPVQMYQFDAVSGRYFGRWDIKGPTGIGIECMGTLFDSQGNGNVIVLGTRNPPPAPGGYVWIYSQISAIQAQHLLEEGTPPNGRMIVTESGNAITSESATQQWLDDGQIPNIRVLTGRIGYDSDVMWNADRCTAITGSPDSVLLEMRASGMPQAVVATPVPNASGDATYRSVAGLSTAGRGIQVAVSPITVVGGQWSIDRVALIAMVSRARPEDG